MSANIPRTPSDAFEPHWASSSCLALQRALQSGEAEVLGAFSSAPP